eukprot:jgi/Galph1/4623/GphlegSOOS_G3209.1
MIDNNKTGAFALIDSLIRHDVKHIFGYPGGAILPIYDELYFWEQKNLISHYLVRHEQAAAHAADAYARSTGKVGVCFATSGPGATNLVTGIATAQMDSIPILVITGQVALPFIGTDAFQETDIFGITLPIVKHSYVVRNPRDMSRIVAEAFYIAKHGRPGPVLIDIPKDITLEKFHYIPNEPNEVDLPGCRPIPQVSFKQIVQAVKLIQESNQPLLYIGGGAISSDSYLEIKALAEYLQIPVTTTLMGKGIIEDTHPLSLGMLGMHGTAYANFAVSECDLLICLGARFDDRVTGKLDEFASKAKVIHVDIDPAEIGKNRIPQVAIIGDIKIIVKQLLEYVKIECEIDKQQTQSWLERIKHWKQDYPLTFDKNSSDLLPQQVIQEINKINNNTAFITTDVGQHQMWAAQLINTGPRKWISSAGLGTMGYGLPAAIGIQIAHPQSNVICITGDSSFQMNCQELATIAQYKLPIKIIIINNFWQGMVRQWQQTFYGERYSHSRMNEGMPDFVQLAKAFGIKGICIKNKNELKPYIEQIFSLKEPIVIDCQVSKEENCYPMVAPGKSNSQMIGLTRQHKKNNLAIKDEKFIES